MTSVAGRADGCFKSGDPVRIVAQLLFQPGNHSRARAGPELSQFFLRWNMHLHAFLDDGGQALCRIELLDRAAHGPGNACRAGDDSPVFLRQVLVEFIIDQNKINRVIVAVKDHVVLQLVQVVVIDCPDGVLLAVSHAGGEGIGQFRPRNRCGLCAKGLDHFDIERNGLYPDFQTLEVRRCFHRAFAVGEVAEACFTKGQRAQACTLQAGCCEFRPKRPVQNIPCDRRTGKGVGYVQHIGRLAKL